MASDNVFESQQKFDFYAVSLTFTLLAASIQTANFGASSVRDFLELASWACLLVSGLAALWRLEWVSVAARVSSLISDLGQARTTLISHQLQGTETVHVASTQSTSSIEQQIANRTASIATLEDQLTELNASFNRRHLVARSFFVLGVTTLVISRAYLPTLPLLEDACRLIRRCS